VQGSRRVRRRHQRRVKSQLLLEMEKRSRRARRLRRRSQRQQQKRQERAIETPLEARQRDPGIIILRRSRRWLRNEH
jgi:hypothetical protein